MKKISPKKHEHIRVQTGVQAGSNCNSECKKDQHCGFWDHGMCMDVCPNDSGAEEWCSGLLEKL